MNKKIVVQFTILTFIINIIFWGGLIVFEQFGFTLEEYPLLNLLYLIGAWSPAIASFFVLRNNNKVSSIKEWMKNIFAMKTSIYNYLFVVALILIYIISLIVTSGLDKVNPIYMIFIWLLGSLLAGAGMEESGWRYILHSELNKKFGYLITCLIIAPIHILWHIPLGIGELFLWNVINVLGITFAAGAVYNVSRGNIFLCLLLHCMFNAVVSTITPNRTTSGIIITSIIMIIVSITAVSINKHVRKQR